jgi:hypothetical protein
MILRGFWRSPASCVAAWRAFRLLACASGGFLAYRGLLGGVVALACLAAPVTAGAHLRSGTVVVDYKASVRHPDTPAYTAQIFQSDRALGLTVKAGHTVVLLGYLGEPVFRIDNAGLWLNLNSPTAAADRLPPKTKTATAPGLRWRLRRGHHSLVWQDARVQGLPTGMTRTVGRAADRRRSPSPPGG